MYLFFDTETDARDIKGRFTYNQCVIQFSYTLCDKNFNIIRKKTCFVSDLAKKIYPNQKIIKLKDIRNGVKWEEIYNDFLEDCYLVQNNNGKIISHNLVFDANVIIYSLKKKKMKYKNFLSLIRKNGLCTKEKTTNFCKLPFPNNPNSSEYKWPKLEELYYILFNEKIIQEHLADKDVEILMKCFIECKRRNIIN